MICSCVGADICASCRQRWADAKRRDKPLENIRRVADMLRQPLPGRTVESYRWRVYRAGRFCYQVGSEAHGWLYDGHRNRRSRFWTRRGAQKTADKLNRKVEDWLLNTGIVSGPREETP